MRERPILMSGPMVRAILAETKTQTRRPAPIEALSFMHHPEGIITWVVQFVKAVKGVLVQCSGGSFTEEVARSIIASQFCPFGKPGDRLWVRETWFKSDKPGMVPIYRADGDSLCPWRPSIHMPRWACRLVLEIVSVRVELLQDISETDALAEGVVDPELGCFGLGPRTIFKGLWDDIYAAKGQGWDANPWVWVVEFRRVEASA